MRNAPVICYCYYGYYICHRFMTESIALIALYQLQHFSTTRPLEWQTYGLLQEDCVFCQTKLQCKRFSIKR